MSGSSDEPDWPGHKFIKKFFGDSEDIILPNKSDDVFTAFHRMVIADGLILSQSSLSNAAALISNTSEAVVPTYDDGSSRRNLYNTKRYHRINDLAEIPGTPKRKKR